MFETLEKTYYKIKRPVLGNPLLTIILSQLYAGQYHHTLICCPLSRSTVRIANFIMVPFNNSQSSTVLTRTHTYCSCGLHLSFCSISIISLFHYVPSNYFTCLLFLPSIFFCSIPLWQKVCCPERSDISLHANFTRAKGRRYTKERDEKPS